MGAVDVFDRSAGPADDMVVVVPDPTLVPRDRPGRLDPPQQPSAGQRPEYVINSLMGHIELATNRLNDRVRIRMRVIRHRREHSHPRPGHAQSSPTQPVLELRRRHNPESSAFSGISQD